MKLSLVVTQGKLAGKEIPVKLSQFLIGRDPECQLRPNSPLVSKRHCAIIQRDGKVFLRDFESTNGTVLNDKPMTGETELTSGDEFRVGPLSFKVKLEATVVEKPGETPIVSPPLKPAKKNDEDSVLEMLLMEPGDGAKMGGVDPIPPGSTVMDVANLSEQTTEDKQDDPKKGGKGKISDAKATSDAAKAILDKYMRRPRG
jgi:predicted component of type VI protein secretion system